MLTVNFKAKVRALHYVDGTIAYRYVKLPALGPHHVDMNKARVSKRFGDVANSALFASVLNNAVSGHCGGSKLRLDDLPPCVTVDERGFLANVTIELMD